MLAKFYLQKTNMLERQLAYATVGFLREVSDITVMLSDAKTTEDVARANDALSDALAAMENLQEQLTHALSAYREECAKGAEQAAPRALPK